MTRLASLLLFMATIGFALYADEVMEDDPRIVIDIYRSGGFKNPDRIQPMEFYRFTVLKEGSRELSWKLEPLKGESRKGTLSAKELDQWLANTEGRFYEVLSDPELGALDEPYMQITVQTWKKTKVRIRVTEKLSQAIEKDIVELARPDE